MVNRNKLFIGAVAAIIVAGTGVANAQVRTMDPPGSVIQDRGILDSNGYTPERGYEESGGAHGTWRSSHPNAYIAQPRRFYRYNGYYDDYGRF
jgi:hypothetical protein